MKQALEGLLGLVIILQFNLTDSTVHEHVLVLGHEFETRIIVLNSPFVIAQVLTSDTPHLIGINDKGVAFDSHTGILFGTAIVLQANFSHRAVEIGLGKERFGLNRLIEVLNGKYIVFKVKRIAPDIHHLVGVDLGIAAHSGCQHSQQQRQTPIYRQNLLHYRGILTAKVKQNFTVAKLHGPRNRFFTFNG